MGLTNHNTMRLLLIFIGTLSLSSGQKNHAGPCRPGENDSLRKNKLPRVQKSSIIGARVPCVDGFANEYPCANIDLESFVSLSDMNGGSNDVEGNDVWGWEKDGRRFAIVGMTTGTAFVEVTDSINPVVIGSLPTHSVSSDWRDIKTYQDHAYIVSEAGSHGLQIFDLNELLTATPYTTFTETSHYNKFQKAHNIFINEDTGFAYVVGASTGPTQCNGGLHMIDVSDPASPEFAGCYSDRGYTHDVQCVVYSGPDSAHNGKEICFASNEMTMDIIDVTDKANPDLLSVFSYSGAMYVHQGWLTEDQKYFLIDDELDEYVGGTRSKTVIVDVSNLNDPELVRIFEGASEAIDHNQYVVGEYTYQANYRAGLEIYKLMDLEDGNMARLGYFDTYVEDNESEFNGVWSNYPYLSSGEVLVNDIEQGLFIVTANLSAAPLTNAPNTIPTTSPTTFAPQSFFDRVVNALLEIVELLIFLLGGSRK